MFASFAIRSALRTGEYVWALSEAQIVEPLLRGVFRAG
jgi:hypothetical protein